MSENDMDASIASAEPLNASGKHNSPDVTPLPLPLRRLRREVGNPLGRHVDRSACAWLIRRFN